MKQEQPGKVTVVVGGQYGSEGKGAITHYLAMAQDYDFATRGGSDNAGHTIWHEGEQFKMQDVPVAWTNPSTKLFIAPGASFSMEQLNTELEWIERFFPTVTDRLWVDRNSGLITEEHRQIERDRKMGDKIGSTVHGCGAAITEKAWRDGFQTASMNKDLPQALISDVSTQIADILNWGGIGICEGTQGTLLSIDHAPFYPFCTSRNAITSSIIAESGIPPSRVGEVVMVVRTHPIRVGGNSGPTDGEELTWDQMSERAGYSIHPEQTTVTKKQRRIFELSDAEYIRAINLNGPTQIALTLADYLSANDHSITEWNDLSDETKNFVHHLETIGGVPVTLIKTGPLPEHIVDRTINTESTLEESQPVST